MWLVDKKVFYHMIDLGFERVEVPVRVKFEYEVKEGAFVDESLSIQTLYNRKALEKRYPKLKSGFLENAIDKTVKQNIHDYLIGCGFIKESTRPRFCR